MKQQSTPRITYSAGGVVLNPKGQVLVVNQNGNSWSLPKGHIDEGEGPIEAAKREIYEESGVDSVEYVKDLGSYKRHKISLSGQDDPSELKNIHIFLFKTQRKLLKPLDPQNPEARWVDKDKVAGLLTHLKDKAFFEKVLKKGL